jgi:hypothetical protein
MGKQTATITPRPPSPLGFAAGVLIGLSVVTPVFAATADGFEDWHTLLLIGSIVLLAAGLILKAIATRAARSRGFREPLPDMRRDRSVDPGVDHPMDFDVAPRRQFH